MTELTDTERALHLVVEELRESNRIGSDDARYFHDRIGLLVAELRCCHEPTNHR
ncbi:hypothetical protein [Halomarina oriensis]|uniref:Uncharacterized protein n=1 Tax=Halomarina oriensis TaxID=671145 RepID=A0A6B0GH51_9EURY|nr:hypothetical protein [Halomarina oriensis]MWG33287.1 hypothetical protein [Halomarina oriensis]